MNVNSLKILIIKCAQRMRTAGQASAAKITRALSTIRSVEPVPGPAIRQMEPAIMATPALTIVTVQLNVVTPLDRIAQDIGHRLRTSHAW